jgi:hypothetical protein
MKCHLCSTTFTRNDNMLRHLRRYHCLRKHQIKSFLLSRETFGNIESATHSIKSHSDHSTQPLQATSSEEDAALLDIITMYSSPLLQGNASDLLAIITLTDFLSLNFNILGLSSALIQR